MGDFNRLWDQIEDNMGVNECDMSRTRSYRGQPHTSTGERGATQISGVTFRDIRDCYIRAVCLAKGILAEENMPFCNEAMKGEGAALCENDIYLLKGNADDMAICQNLLVEIEKIMGIYPNIKTPAEESHE